MSPTRRQTIATIGGIATLGALTTFTKPADASRIQINNLSIPDKDGEITNQVTELPVQLNGEFTYTTDAAPDKWVLRFEGKRQSSQGWTQLEATDQRTDVGGEMNESFSFTADLLDLPDVTSSDVTPSEIGASRSISVDFRLRLEVTDGGDMVGEKVVRESTVVSVEKTEAAFSAEVGASGGVTVVGDN